MKRAYRANERLEEAKRALRQYEQKRRVASRREFAALAQNHIRQFVENELVAVNSTERISVPGRHGVCENPSCAEPIARSETGRRKRFCSDKCRRTSLGYGAGDLNRSAAVFSAETPKKPNEINQAKVEKTSAARLAAPSSAIETELGRWRSWDRVVSADGVVAYCTFVGKDVVAKCGFGKLAVLRDLGLLYRAKSTNEP